MNKLHKFSESASAAEPYAIHATVNWYTCPKELSNLATIDPNIFWKVADPP